MHVCILALANPLFWTRHYVDAFRQCAEVLTVGPPFGPEFLVTLQMNSLPEWAQPNDIETNLNGVNLAHVLPNGWEPDLIVAISDFGRPLNPLMRQFSCPKVYLSIDTWQCPRDYCDARCYDFVFAAQREFVPRLRANGARNVHWLPLGCNPAVHYPARVAKTCDIAFAGALVGGVHEERRRLLTALQQHFTMRSHQRVYGDALCRACCRGRFVFNHSAVSDLNMRVFETLAMKSVLLTNRDSERNGLLDLFQDGTHLLVYNNEEHLISLVERYLNDDAERLRIAQDGYDEVMAKHTYLHRVQTMLSIIADRVPGFPQPAPPKNLLELPGHLPPDPGFTVDLGMTLAPYADILRKQGVLELIGISPDPICPENAWDQTFQWPGSEPYPQNADSVIIDTLTPFPVAHEDVFHFAHQLLCEGGLLLCRLTMEEIQAMHLPADVTAFSNWLLALNFHLLEVHQHVNETTGQPDSFIFNARKRTRTLMDVVDEGLRGIPFENKAIRDYVAQMPPGI
ncbi:MAG TPA: glycosyltransferase [Candidatus Hydrogenedentes bacterium]|nr:glycosyltransferase [Candidatus Hydrogenedentota bacterium]